MASLQDQLLKAGLVSEKEAKQASKNKRKKAKAQRKGLAQEVDQSKVELQKKVKAQAERDRQLNLERKAEADQRAIEAQINQLIDLNKIDLEDGEVAYSFTDGKTVKKIYLPEKIRDQLLKGMVAIVKEPNSYQVVPKRVAEKIAQRDEARVIVLVDAHEEIDADDPYAEFQVPDDLMW